MSLHETPEALGQPGILVQGTALRNAITAGIREGMARWNEGYGTWRQSEQQSLAEFLALYIAAQVAPVADQHTARVADKAVREAAVLQCTGADGAVTAEDYARYAAEAMNAATADDTEFIADGSTVSAYTHGHVHVSATFVPDEDRPYPGDDDLSAPWFGVCEFCRSTAELPAVLSADPDQRVCAKCHADPRIPTIEAGK